MSKAKFVVKFIETIPEPDFKESMTFKTISPIVIKRNKKVLDGSYYPEVDTEEYFSLFKRNLEEK